MLTERRLHILGTYIAWIVIAILFYRIGRIDAEYTAGAVFVVGGVFGTTFTLLLVPRE
jgi:hypothetical protein